MSNSLDPDQDRNSNLGPNCLQRLSADDKLSLTRKEFNFQRKHIFMHIIKKKSNVSCQQISYQKSKVSVFKQQAMLIKIMLQTMETITSDNQPLLFGI